MIKRNPHLAGFLLLDHNTLIKILFDQNQRFALLIVTEKFMILAVGDS